MDLRADIEGERTLRPWSAWPCPPGSPWRYLLATRARCAPAPGWRSSTASPCSTPRAPSTRTTGARSTSILVNLSQEPFTLRRGDRVAQLVVAPCHDSGASGGLRPGRPPRGGRGGSAPPGDDRVVPCCPGRGQDIGGCGPSQPPWKHLEPPPVLCYRCGSHVPDSSDTCPTCGQKIDAAAGRRRVRPRAERGASRARPTSPGTSSPGATPSSSWWAPGPWATSSGRWTRSMTWRSPSRSSTPGCSRSPRSAPSSPWC